MDVKEKLVNYGVSLRWDVPSNLTHMAHFFLELHAVLFTSGMSKLYRPYLQREAAARGLLEVTLSTGGEGKLRVFIIVINTVNTSF